MRDVELMGLAERLALEFPDMQARDLWQAVTSAVAGTPNGDSLFVEQAARARLATARDGEHQAR